MGGGGWKERGVGGGGGEEVGGLGDYWHSQIHICIFSLMFGTLSSFDLIMLSTRLLHTHTHLDKEPGTSLLIWRVW